MDRDLLDVKNYLGVSSWPVSCLETEKFIPSQIDLHEEDHGLYLLEIGSPSYSSAYFSGAIDGYDELQGRRRATLQGYEAIKGLAQFLNLSTEQTTTLLENYAQRKDFKLGWPDNSHSFFALKKDYNVSTLVRDDGEIFCIKEYFSLQKLQNNDYFNFIRSVEEGIKRAEKMNQNGAFTSEIEAGRELAAIMKRRYNIVEDKSIMEKLISFRDKLMPGLKGSENKI